MARRQVPSILAKLTRHGGISLPAPLRHRWEVDWVLIEDHGSHAVIRPVADPEDNTVPFARTPRSRGPYIGP
ncbi:MAG: hypothetical protein ACR2LF_04085 [Jatrophihabitantaceae bacterium]